MLNKINRFVFIESNTTGTGQLFLKEAMNLGCEVIFLTKTPEKYLFLSETFIHPIIINTESYSDILFYLKSIENIKAVFSTSEFFIGTAALVAEHLGLPCNQLSAITTCRNKNILYQELAAAGIYVPTTFSVSRREEAVDAFNQLVFPLIIKPSSGSGSMGVKLCLNDREALEHLDLLLEQDSLRTTSNDILTIVQQYIEGSEYSIETISERGIHEIIGITKKHLSPLPYFIESGHDFPAICNPEEKKLIEDTVKNALNAIHYQFGPSHTELRIYNGIPYIIEVNPRLAGGVIPSLIKASTGIDLIKQIINLYLGENINLTPKITNYASIRFLIAEQSGKIKKLQITLKNDSTIFDYRLLKKEDDSIKVHHDFRDRIGYVITSHVLLEKSAEFAEEFIKSIEFQLEQDAPTSSFDYVDTGILKETLCQDAFEIIYKSPALNVKLKELNYLSLIDEAHLLMLHNCEILSLQNFQAIFNQIRKFKEGKFSTLIKEKAERGTYLLYERELIRTLDVKVAGFIHTARSRNDLYETLFRLSFRESFFKVYESLWKLRSKILVLSIKTQNLPFPIYSQYQTALPSTFAHYLLGIEEALFRDETALQELYKFLNLSPLGSGAGGGTSFSIKPQFTANLLGFDDFLKNSLDAIASKDIALRYLSLLNIIGTTLSRLTEDLQLWSTCEFGLISFPDNLLGGSSMMPQKKNPYLLELIKAKIDQLSGNLVASFAATNKVPFGNSYETKSVLVSSVENSSHLIIDTLDLLVILLNGLQFIPSRITKNLCENLTIATYLSECLARDKSTTKEAHKTVGDAIYEARESGNDPFKTILSLTSISENPLDWAYANEYGGGPGKNHTENVLINAAIRLNKDSHWRYTKISQLNKFEAWKDELAKELLQTVC